MARRALFIRSLIDALQRARAVGENNDAPPEDLVAIDGMIERGEYFDRSFLLLAHGASINSFYIELSDPRPGEPSQEPAFKVDDPDDWEEAALRVMTMSMAVDRDAFASWVPYQKL